MIRKSAIIAVTALAATGVVVFLVAEDGAPGPGVHRLPRVVTSSPGPEEQARPLTGPRETDARDVIASECNDFADGMNDAFISTDDIRADVEAYVELKQSLSQRLAVSSSPEHLQVAALLLNDPAERLALMERAVSASPTNDFLLWSAVQVCAELSGGNGCSRPDWERKLLEVDGQNSETWIRIAANRYQAGDTDAALAALRRAATAAETREYWPEMIETIERGLAAGSDYGFSERAGWALSLAATEMPRYRDYVTMCEEQAAQSVDWAYQCIAYGELVERQGKTDMSKAIALSIQRLALNALGNDEQAAEVERRLLANREALMASARENAALHEQLVVASPAMFSAYLAAVRAHGEAGARELLAEEARRVGALELPGTNGPAGWSNCGPDVIPPDRRSTQQ